MVELTTPAVGFLELVANVTGPLEGTIDDWPDHIRDGIFDKLEKRMQASHILNVEYVVSKCDKDVDSGWYVWVLYRVVNVLRVIQ